VYDTVRGNYLKSWGQAAMNGNDNQRKELLLYFKLFLIPDDADASYNHHKEEFDRLKQMMYIDPIVKNNLEPINIIAEYLKRLNEFVCDYIMQTEIDKSFFRRIFTSSQKNKKFSYVLTIPEMYSIQARSDMMEAAVKAGLIERKYKNRLVFIKEPAAALYCQYRYKEFLKASNGIGTFIICDAGGGTVDLLTYKLRVEEDNNGNNVEAITQIGRGRGDTCGSVSIDKEFENYIWDIFDNHLGGFKFELFRRILKQSLSPVPRYALLLKGLVIL
jgi:hypothetical protein